MNGDVIQVLKACPLFRGFTETGLQIIGSIAQHKTVPPGTPLFVEQMIGESLYVIGEGSVKLSVRGPQGDEIFLTRVDSPDSLGEAALLRPGPRQCSAIVETPSSVIEITRRDVASLQRSKPQACLKLMMGVVDLVGERLREADQDLKGFMAWRTGR